MNRRLSKKALDEGFEAQGELPDGQGRALWCEDEHRLGLKPIIRKVFGPRWERGRSWRSTSDTSGPTSTLSHDRRPEEVHWLIVPSVSAQVFSLALEHFAREEVGAGNRSESASCSWSTRQDGIPQRRS
jgi:hypothetical protein